MAVPSTPTAIVRTFTPLVTLYWLEGLDLAAEGAALLVLTSVLRG